jgi:hypothetical protein
MFTIVGRPVAGGADPHNDCLFNEILAAHGGKLAKDQPTAEALKAELKLQRDDLVPISSLRRVQNLYRTRINVSGDCTYVSNAPFQRRVDLVLASGHFSSERQTAVEAELKRKPGIPISWMKNADGTVSIFSDKGAKENIPAMTFSTFMCKNRDKHAKHKTHADVGTTLEDVDNGEGCAVQGERGLQAALRELQQLSTMKFARLPASQQEWVANAMGGGLIWAKNGYEGDAIQYDVNSQYPSLFIAKSQTWPVGEGTYQTLKGKPTAATSGKKYWPYGIYRTKALACNKVSVKLYRTHRGAGHQHYTHYDLEAYEAATGKAVELADDHQHNALIWDPKARAAGSTIFGVCEEVVRAEAGRSAGRQARADQPVGCIAAA